MKRNLADIKTSISSHGPLLKRLIVPEDEKGKLLNMNYAWLKKGEKTHPHAHTDCEEYFLFLEGKGEITLDKYSTPISKGDIVNIAPNQTHVIENTSTKTLHFLSFLVLSRS